MATSATPYSTCWGRAQWGSWHSCCSAHEWPWRPCCQARWASDRVPEAAPELGDFKDLAVRLRGKRFPFRWGKKRTALAVAMWTESSCFLVPCPNGDGSVFVALCFQAVHMESAMKHFYVVDDEQCFWYCVRCWLQLQLF